MRNRVESMPMVIVDGHCDTLWQAPKEGRTLLERSSKGHLDLPRLIDGGVQLQFFALFSDPAHGPVGFTVEALAMVERFYQAVDGSEGRLLPLRWREDLDQLAPGRVLGLLSIEGAEPLHGRVDILRLFFRLGVRAVGLTWNFRNELADGQLDGDSRGGLTPAGRAIVREMGRLGMIVDCSHLSDAGFWDLLEQTEAPIIASHSNARAICNHKRNLTDDQLKAIASRGGVVGINFLPHFLNEKGDASLDDVVRHIEHMAEVAGIQTIGLGSDYDGIGKTPVGLEHVGKISAVAEALLRRGYAEEEVRAVMGENYLRLLRKILPACKASHTGM